MRLVIARCSVDYIGRLTAHLPMATRLLLVKADGSVSIHADDRAYKPLNWMSPPCTLKDELTDGSGTWTVTNKAGEQLIITIEAVEHDHSARARHRPRPAEGRRRGASCSGCSRCTWRPSAPAGRWSGASTRPRSARSTCSAATPTAPCVAVEIKRRGEIDGVEQLTRYLELLNRDPLLAPVKGVFAAQEIKPQARVLAAGPRHRLRHRRLRRPQGHRRPAPPRLSEPGYRPVARPGDASAE